MSLEHRITSQEELLAQLSWVQRLARSLAQDVALADDVSQEAMRITLAQPEGRVPHGGALRAWLVSVVRRLVLDDRRAERGRRLREQAAARQEAQPATYEVVERHALQQRVAQAVMELAEPYRSTLLYRFLDDLSTAEVAARMQINEAAVRKRLSRGLSMLRATLDCELGEEGRWVLALVAPLGLSTARSAATIAVGQGALLMGAKVKLMAALVICLTGWFAWHELGKRGEVVSPPSTPPPRVATSGAPSAQLERQDVEPAPVEEVPPARGVVVQDSREDVTLLQVRVQDPLGSELTNGEITCFWDEERGVELGLRRRFLTAPIAGAVTTLRLPPKAFEALVAATVAGQAPATVVRVSDLRRVGDHVEARGTVTHEVVLVVGRPEENGMLAGAIDVDGEPRVPRGLMILLESPPVLARVNTEDALYRVGPVSDTATRLWITSEETVPLQLELPEADRRADPLDLHLASERTLELTVLDEGTGAPVAGRELLQTTNIETERRQRRVVYRGHSSIVVTDAEGRCTIRGLPLEGHFSIHAEMTPEPREFRMRDGSTMNLMTLPDPVWTLRLEKSMPAKLTHTLRVKPPVTPAVVFGYLPASLGGARVMSRQVAPNADVLAAPIEGAERRWQFEANVPSKQQIWIEEGGAPVSETVEVAVTASGPLGPIELPPLRGAEITVRLIGVPSEGRVDLVFDRNQRASHTLSGEEIFQKFKVVRPTPLEVHVTSAGDGDFELSSLVQEIEIDPAQREVVVDLHAEDRRDFELLINGVPVEGDGVLGLLRCAGATVDGRQRVLVGLHDGRSTRASPVPAGRFVYLYQSDRLAGWVAGVVDLGGPTDRVVRLDMPGTRRARSTLGKGIELLRVGQVSLDSLPAKSRTMLWSGGQDTIVLPANGEFRILEE
jgi:RNA polymerase sigma-70 factor (ECF subfamily)